MKVKEQERRKQLIKFSLFSNSPWEAQKACINYGPFLLKNLDVKVDFGRTKTFFAFIGYLSQIQNV
jgi:hypothetical protein